MASNDNYSKVILSKQGKMEAVLKGWMGEKGTVLELKQILEKINRKDVLMKLDNIL